MVITTNYGYCKKFFDDSLNKRGKRNQNNTLTEAYNCGGFALKTFSWYCPYDVDILDYALDYNLITRSQYDKILAECNNKEMYNDELNAYLINSSDYDNDINSFPDYKCWQAIYIMECMEDYCVDVFGRYSPFMQYFIDKMLEEIKNLRLIQSTTEVKPNEYCIAFRVGRGDFHYIRSDVSGKKWIQKMGSRRITGYDTTEDSRKNAISEEKFDKMFGSRYSSQTILFAKTLTD